MRKYLRSAEVDVLWKDVAFHGDLLHVYPKTLKRGVQPGDQPSDFLVSVTESQTFWDV